MSKTKIIKFLTIFIFFQILVLYINNNVDLTFLKIGYTKLFEILGFQTKDNIIAIKKPHMYIKIINECTGTLMYFTLISLFFSFLPLKKAIFYSIIFAPIIFLINFLRIYTSILAGIIFNSSKIFEFVHNYLWFIITPIIILTIFYLIVKKENIKI